MQIPPALRQRSFALYWSGQFVSLAGSNMQLAALLWHLRDLSDQPLVVSGIGLARFLPVLLLAPFGGVVADSYNRRKILFITQSTLMLSALMLGLLTYLQVIQIWHIYLLSALNAVAMAFDGPARQALVPHLVPRDTLTNAFSLQSIASNSGAILGPALSGVVIAGLGQEYTYWINALTFLAVIAALAAIGPIAQEQRSAVVRGVKGSFLAIGEGVRFIVGKPIILSSMLLDFVATFFSSANTLLPFVARDLLKVNEVAYGWLVAAESMGGVVVGLAFSQRESVRRQGQVLFGAVCVYGAATILFGLSRSFALALLALTLVGAADAVSTILRNTIRQISTPDHIRGRMVSINQVFFMGGPQLGNIEAGLVAQAFGIPFAIVSGGIGCIVGAVLLAARWPELRNYRHELAAAAAD